MIYITKRPEKQVDTEQSRWTAVFNPYIFEITRKDYNILSTALRPAYHATKPTVETSANPVTLPTQLFAGDNVYINSGMYKGTYVVHSVSGKYVTLDTAYIGVGGSGWINLVDLLLNFTLYVNVYNAAGVILQSVYPKPDSTGLALVDLAGVLRSLADNSDTTGFTLINEKASGSSGEFYIGYGFSYRVGGLQITTTEVVDTYSYFWNAAAKQITGKLFSYGQNLAEAVPFQLSGWYAKFLSGFEIPTMWVGYPFTLDFIYSENFKDVYVERHQQNKNINGAATSAESADILLTSEQRYVNRMMLADEDATTTQMEVWLETGAAIPSGGGFVDDGFMVSGFVSQYAAPTTGG